MATMNLTPTVAMYMSLKLGAKTPEEVVNAILKKGVLVEQKMDLTIKKVRSTFLIKDEVIREYIMIIYDNLATGKVHHVTTAYKTVRAVETYEEKKPYWVMK